MHLLPHLAARIFNEPLLIAPAKLDAIIAGLGQRLGVPGEAAPAPDLFTAARGDYRKPGYRVVDNVGVIDVFGVLAHRGRIEADSSYVMGYQEIARMLNAALADADVGGVLLNLDTPGGEAAGAFDMADMIRQAGQVKPVWAAVSDMALSAGYLLASGAQRVGISRSGVAGSIGVVMRHVDMSRAMANEGIQVTHIFAGARKVDGNPFEPLPAAVRADFQRRIDAMYSMFVSAVAASRGLPEQAVRDTEAGVLDAQEALAARLADTMTTPDQMIGEMQDAIRRRKSQSARAGLSAQPARGDTRMNETPTAGTPAPAQFTQADLDRARADGLAEGARIERERIQAVEGCMLAGHEALIAALKFDGKTSGPEAALKILQAEQQKLAAVLAHQRADAPAPLPLAPVAGVGTRAAETSPQDDPRPIEERCKAQWEADPKLRAEFGDLATYTAFARAQASGRVRILGRRDAA